MKTIYGYQKYGVTMTENDQTKNITRSFHKSQVGYIAECLEPVSGESTIGDMLTMIPSTMHVQSIPVEEYGGVGGLAPVDIMASKNRSLWESLKSNTVVKYIRRDTLVLDAMENIEKALSIILNAKRENPFEDFLIFHHGKYFGVGSFLKLTEQISALRMLDLQRARTVQEFIIQNRHHCGERIAVRSYIKMANDLGGDFFQAMEISDSLSIVACFDVSGKNVSAALTASMIGSFFSTINTGGFMKNAKPVDFVRLLNDVCRDQTPSEIYVTGVLLFADFNENTVKLFNCGYTPVYQFAIDSDGKRNCKVLNPNIIPLGLDNIDDLEKNMRIVPISSGLRFFLYSDGLIEARDQFGKMYGEEKLRQFLFSNHRLNPDEFMAEFENMISSYIGDSVLADDITAFTVQF
jgi:sigma-B regulation protein RsbU (phosphoserine phosphatase)